MRSHPLRQIFLNLCAMVLGSILLCSGARAITPEAYSDLAPELALQVPMVEALTVFGWSRKEYFFIVENALIDLRYFYKEPNGTGTPAVSAAIQSFQRTLGHSPTGSLRVNEFVELVERTNAFWQVAIIPSPMILVRDGNVVTVEGTITPDHTPDPDPIQTTNLRCRRDLSHCLMATAKVKMGDQQGNWFHAGAELELRTAELKVTRWDANDIDAQYRPYFCVTDTISIDLRAQEVRIYRNRSEDDACADVKATRETLKMADGAEGAQAFWEARRDRAHLLRSKAFQKLVEEVQSERKKK